MLVLNPITAAMIEPYAKRVCIVPWGIDPARFPWPVGQEAAVGNGNGNSSPIAAQGSPTEQDSGDGPSRYGRNRETRTHREIGTGAGDAGAAQADEGDLRSRPRAGSSRPSPNAAQEGGVRRPSPNGPEPRLTRLFMAAVAGEFIKGFHIAHEACRLLRETRSDFELVVTFDPPGPIDEFTRSVGWCSQAELPLHYRAADICLVPTIAQDALSITSVEAMAAGIPVIASRIGGMPYTVSDGVTGLLCEPGNPADLARKIARLLDDPALRRRMGLAGRKRFEQDFTWETVIERYWRPLLVNRVHR